MCIWPLKVRWTPAVKMKLVMGATIDVEAKADLGVTNGNALAVEFAGGATHQGSRYRAQQHVAIVCC